MLTPIIILFLLSVPLLIALLISRLSNSDLNVSQYACWGLGMAFIFFCIGHFVQTEMMVAMLPPWAPLRLTIIYLTGLLVLLIGLALFIPQLQMTAAKLAIVVLVLFFPINIYAALYSVDINGQQWGLAYLLVRAPLQIILVAWAYFLCIKIHPNVIPKNRQVLFE